ncbi:MAG: von Willebrand factor type A domain-containing protein [Planctomycetes bacterium]|nr:von Willebrand factor type A domain-containing protein [Planctomycetota bacterium]
MTLNPDDPRLTAYALGELEPAEAAAVEAELAASEDARRVVAEIRATAEALSELYANETAPRLRAEQHLLILQNAAGSGSRRTGPARIIYFQTAALIAASLVITVTVAFFVHDRGATGGDSLRLLEAGRTGAAPEGWKLNTGEEKSGKLDSKTPRKGADSEAGGEKYRSDVSFGELRGGKAGDLSSLTENYKSPEGGAAASKRAPAEETRRFAGPDGAEAQNKDKNSEPIRERGERVAGEEAVRGDLGGSTTGGSVIDGNTTGGKIASGGGGVTRKPVVTKEIAKHKDARPSDGIDRGTSKSDDRKKETFADKGILSLSDKVEDKSADAPGPKGKLQSELSPSPSETKDSLQTEKSPAEPSRSEQSKSEQLQKKFRAGKSVESKDSTSADAKPASKPQKDADGDRSFDDEQLQILNTAQTESRGVPRRRRIQQYAYGDIGPLRGHESGLASTSLVRAPSGAPQPMLSGFVAAQDRPVSSFSLIPSADSYARVRRSLLVNKTIPDKTSVHVGEMINYFHYETAAPSEQEPVAVSAELAQCPWNPAHLLLWISARARDAAGDPRAASNVVVCWAANEPGPAENRISISRESLRLFAKQLGGNDTFAIVTNSVNPGVALEATKAGKKDAIDRAIDALPPQSSGDPAAAVQLAFETARKNAAENGNNGVLLITNGIENSGVRKLETSLASANTAGDVALNILNINENPTNESALVRLAESGNGQYYSIDNIQELQKSLADSAMLPKITVARDVQIRVVFDASRVLAYRVFDTNNSSNAASGGLDLSARLPLEPGIDWPAGQRVSVLYELIKSDPAVPAAQGPAAQAQSAETQAPQVSGSICSIRVHYKLPDGSSVRNIDIGVRDTQRKYVDASQEFQFCAAVATLGVSLSDLPGKGLASVDLAHEIAVRALAKDADSYRREFLELTGNARAILNLRK